MQQTELDEYHQAADSLIAACRCEGIANVLLDIRAYGTLLVATEVGRTPEVLADQRAGALIGVTSYAEIVNNLKRFFLIPPIPVEVRAHGRHNDWGLILKAIHRCCEAFGMQQ